MNRFDLITNKNFWVTKDTLKESNCNIFNKELVLEHIKKSKRKRGSSQTNRQTNKQEIAKMFTGRRNS